MDYMVYWVTRVTDPCIRKSPLQKLMCISCTKSKGYAVNIVTCVKLMIPSMLAKAFSGLCTSNSSADDCCCAVVISH